MKRVSVLMLVAFWNTYAAAQEPSAAEILKKVDANMVVDRAVSTVTMVIESRVGTRKIRSKSWIKGQDSAFVEYLSPAREKGKKMLRLGDKLWMYLPEPNDRIITISGHLLRQSVMGSDLSYEDLMENRHLSDMYNAEIVAEDTIMSRRCLVLNLTAKGQDIAYYQRRIWVDAERWLILKEERYAKSGRLLKTTDVLEVFRQEGRWLPKRIKFKDELSKSRGTIYIVESINFQVDIPDDLFTKAALRQ
jgi:outer membrane lipoprotein-sorting protein